MELLAELNEAFDLAAHDNSVKVIVLAAEGPDFSSGHAGVGNLDMATYKPSGSWSDFKAPGQEGHWGVEQEFFPRFLLALAKHSQTHHRRGTRLGNCRRTHAGLAL